MSMEYLTIYLCLLQFLSLCLTVFSVQVISPLVKFIARYHILFDADVNGIVFLIYVFDSSLLMYKNATDFCVLICILQFY